ncbi:MAG: nucleotidyltransferase domain-containing protein [Elusimicrobiota bacterium]
MKSLEKKITEIVNLLKKEISPQKIILFGSRSKGNEKSFSDIDICVRTDTKPDHRKLRIISEKIDQLAGIYSVDLIFWEDLREDFQKMIEKTGKVLYEEK